MTGIGTPTSQRRIPRLTSTSLHLFVIGNWVWRERSPHDGRDTLPCCGTKTHGSIPKFLALGEKPCEPNTHPPARVRSRGHSYLAQTDNSFIEPRMTALLQ